MKRIFIFGILLLVFSGCATKTTKLKPTPASNEQLEAYKLYSCTQITSSLAVLEKRAQRVAGIQNDKAKSDAILISWGWILYGVPYLFLDGNSNEKAEFETILGQKQALEDLLIQKNCSVNSSEVIVNVPDRY
jgi:hypothetical protein